MQVTISTHNGSQSHRAHNIRKDYVVNKQEHIDITKSNLNEILYDEEPHKAYNRIFGQSLKEYNAKQKRPERRIKDYYTVIKRDKKKHTVYEMIIQVGGKDNKIDISTHKAILKEFYTEWSVRNPQLECIGAYIHCDEATPHLHLDYVPVAVGYTKGMSIQNGLVKALGLQGFEKAGKETAQIQWERSENKILENICNKYGIEVEHPKIAGIKHLETETYKANAKLTEKQKLIDKKMNNLNNLDSLIEMACTEKNEKEVLLAELNQEIKNKQNDNITLSNNNEKLRADINASEIALNSLRNDLKALKGKILSQQEINALEGKKTLTGALKGVSYEEYLSLKKTALRANKAISECDKLREQLEEVKKERDTALSDNSKIKIGLTERINSRISELERDKAKKDKELNDMYKHILYIRDNLSEKSKDEFNKLSQQYKQQLTRKKKHTL